MTNIPDLIERLETAANDQNICGVDIGRSGSCHAGYTMEEAAQALRELQITIDAFPVNERNYIDATNRIEQLEERIKVLQNSAHIQRKSKIEHQARIEQLEGGRKKDCVAFFRWFWNQPGTNAEQGYDSWQESLQEQDDER